MEVWQLPYQDIMSMPRTLRGRLVLKKVDLERDRAAKLSKK